MTDDITLARPGNSALRKEVGEDFRIATHITEERIRSCETIIRKAGDDFFTDAEADLAALEKLCSTPADEPLNAEAVAMHIYNVRSLAKVLGFTLITDMCVHMVHVLDDTELNPKKRKLVVGKLVEALRLAFTQRIRDDGGNAGQALLMSLRANW